MNEGYKYVLAIQDVFSRYSVLIPTKDCSSETAAQMFYEKWISQFGIPLVVQSDRGTHFLGTVFTKFCRQLGITQWFSSPNHPQSQGQMERQNQLLDNVRCLMVKDRDSWPRAIVAVQFAHNTAVNETTGYMPYELVYGQWPRRPESRG